MTLADHAQYLHDLGAPIIRGVVNLITAPTPAPAEPPAPVINTSGIVNFITTKIVPLLLAALGVIFISRAGKGEMSRVLTSSAIAIIGLGFIAGGALLFLFGRNLVNLIFGAS